MENWLCFVHFVFAPSRAYSPSPSASEMSVARNRARRESGRPQPAEPAGKSGRVGEVTGAGAVVLCELAPGFTLGCATSEPNVGLVALRRQQATPPRRFYGLHDSSY